MSTILTKVRAELSAQRAIIKKNIANEAALRASFLLQVVGMMINNTSLLAVWVFFFQATGEVNRWSVKETIALQGLIALVYGIGFSFFHGVRTLPQAVHLGSFDSFLLTPRNLYLRIFTAKIKTSAFGDMIYGVILLGLYFVMAHLSLLQTILLLALVVPTTLIFVNVAFCVSLLAFLIPDAGQIADEAFEIFFSPSLYPASLYSGFLRFIFLFGIPSLAIGGLPVEIVRDMKFSWFFVVWAIAIFWTMLANVLLARAVKRYEGGNLISSRI